MNNTDRNAFKPITENPIILDFEECKYADEIHNVLKEKFGLPQYYGKNWDALWDCLRGLFITEGDVTVQIKNFGFLAKELQEYCKTMFEIFDDVSKETPNVVFTIIS